MQSWKLTKTMVKVGQNQLFWKIRWPKNLILGIEPKNQLPPVAKLWPNIFQYILIYFTKAGLIWFNTS